MGVKQELIKALWQGEASTPFATGARIDTQLYSMPTALTIQGTTTIELPLSQEDLLKLRELAQPAPYGHGDRTIFDSSVRKAWQIDSSQVSCTGDPHFFTNTVSQVASAALATMGVDSKAHGVEVKLYKMLLYETGGHFKFHRDTEKEHGMFATLIIQLPTQSGHGGGALTIQQWRNSSKQRYDFHSTTEFFYTAFFCDCEHQLEEVTSGSRLCLVFNVVWNNTNAVSVDYNMPFFITALPRVRSLLQQWPINDGKLVIPLGHKYSKNSMRFAGLKGHDRVVAALVLECDFLDVHLCMLSKWHIHSLNDLEDSERKEQGLDENNSKTKYNIHNWVSPLDASLDYEDWVSKEIEPLILRFDTSDKHEPFDSQQDEYKFDPEGYTGNEGGTDEYFYHVAALVVWPKSKRVKILMENLGVKARTSVLNELIINKEPVDRVLEVIRDGFKSGSYFDKGLDELRVAEYFRELRDGGDLQGATAVSKLLSEKLLSRSIDVGKSGALVRELLEFGVKYELREQVLEFVECAPLQCLMPVALSGEIEAINGRLNEEYDRWCEKDKNIWYAASVVNGMMNLILELVADHGAQGVAVGLVEKLLVFLPEPISVKQIHDLDREVIVWLVCRGLVSEQALSSYAQSGHYTSIKQLVDFMAIHKNENVATFIGLNKPENEAARSAFVLLLCAMVKKCQAFDEDEQQAEAEYDLNKDEQPAATAALIKELLRIGDAAVVETLVSVLMTRVNLLWKLLKKSSGVIEVAMSSGDASRDGLKKLVEVRMSHLLAGMSYGQEVVRKKIKLCGVIDPKQVGDNPRRLRVAHDIRREQWKSHAEREVEELELVLQVCFKQQ